MSSYIDYHKTKWNAAKDKSQTITPMGLGDSHPITMSKFNPPIPRAQHYGALNERQQLQKLGVGEVHATLAIPYLYYLPRTSDADAQGVQVIVAALQRALGVPETGYMGDRTANAIEAVSGSDWFDKRWNQIVGDVLTRTPRGGLSGYVSVGETGGAGGFLGKFTTTQKVIGAAAIIGAVCWFSRK